ncbi:MAG TPA: hypothetical protein VNV82_14225 [Bryobacteraceae bacterium]|nr:hypothetical protein [Bryobacteraceae bacterium]
MKFLAAIVAFMVALPATAQTPIPRMPGGKPNLNGLWQAMTTAYWDLEDHSAQAGPVLELGAIGVIPAGGGVVEGGKIPYKSAALAKKKENFANRLKLDPEVKCYLPGVPRATYMPYPFQIVQSQNDVLIAYTYDSAARTILVSKHRDAELDTWMGTSNGKWEGDTFVVDVKGFNGRPWLDRAGNFATDSLHVVERYSMLDANTLNYEATIEDPAIFTRPWKISFPLHRHREKGARLFELKCVEFVEDLVYGEVDKKPTH